MRMSDEHRRAYHSIAGSPPSLEVGHVGGKNLNLDFICGWQLSKSNLRR
jgi:hypothetical protein